MFVSDFAEAGGPHSIDFRYLFALTDDGGQTFSYPDTDDFTWNKTWEGYVTLTGIARISNTILVTGTQGFIIRLEDGGHTWKDVLIPGIDESFYLSSVTAANNLFYITGENGLLLRSDDGGLTFSQMNVPTTGVIDNVAFKDLNNGVIASVNTETLNTIWWTSDGGQTWQESQIIAEDIRHLRAQSLLWTSDNELMALRGHIVLRSVDGGRTWLQEGFDTPGAMYYYNSQHNETFTVLNPSEPDRAIFACGWTNGILVTGYTMHTSACIWDLDDGDVDGLDLYQLINFSYDAFDIESFGSEFGRTDCFD